ncbi:MAG: hypothetical protein H0T51_08570 [Pirellulales bacterium]|nr:hypothetical protein [Pirellulales bacterium]
MISILAQLRPCGARDHLWLAWNTREKLTPAKIRDRWNKLSDADRQSTSPRRSGKIDHAGKGREIVEKGLRLAKREDNALGKELRLSRLLK